MDNPLAYQPEPLLLSLVGGSPQVVTETLYGLHKTNNLPKHIRIITTKHGYEQILQHELLGPEGKINQFAREYKLEPIACDESNVWVVKDATGVPLEDVRTLEQQTALADFITQKVRSLSREMFTSPLVSIDSIAVTSIETQKKQLVEHLRQQLSYCEGLRSIEMKTRSKKLHFQAIHDKYSIHASIAGGRKSMTFLLGYAMSLFARRHDRISHVLVDQRVESNPKFYYPTATPHIVHDHNGQLLDFSQMQVQLAEIPLVRMAHNMPASILDAQHSYSETVALFDALHHHPIELVMDFTPRSNDKKHKGTCYRISCSGQQAWLNAEDMAYLWGWIRHGEPVEADDNIDLSLRILECYIALITGEKQVLEDVLAALKFFIGVIDDDAFNKEFVLGKGGDDIAQEVIDGEKGFDQLGGILGCAYNKRRGDIRKRLSQYLGADLAALYVPDNIVSKSDGPAQYALTIPANAITLTNPPVEF